jgi:signal transduction histidine kinase
MRLGEFIVSAMEPILVEWEAFAATQLPAAASMTREALRNHASQMLTAIAKDLSEPQSAEAQAQKSKGLAPAFADAPETAAETNALLRAQGGFDINQMAAEYRALRASVLRLWAKELGSATTDLQDTIRFNEAIDQALAESIAFFSAELERSRNLLLGMLGHDMRNPLSAILITARYLAKLNAGELVSRAAHRLINSGARIQALLSDLVDFNRTNLGVGIHIVPSEIDLESVFRDQLELLRAANPSRAMVVNVTGDVLGHWDANRIHQVLGNLVTNALKYGASDMPVSVGLMGNDTHIVFQVANHGPVIPAQFMSEMFEPRRRGPSRGEGIEIRDDGSLGLGLYITREIVLAHGGDIAVHSDEGETVFTVKLPRVSVLTPATLAA